MNKFSFFFLSLSSKVFNFYSQETKASVVDKKKAWVIYFFTSLSMFHLFSVDSVESFQKNFLQLLTSEKLTSREFNQIFIIGF